MTRARGCHDRHRAAVTGGSAADGSGEGGRTGSGRLVPWRHLDEGDRMVAAPPQMGQRTDDYDGDRRRPERELYRRGDLGGERRDGEVQEERKLTLEAWVVAAVAEEAGSGGDGARRPSGVRKKTGTIPTMSRLPARFRRRGGRGRRGGTPGVISGSRGGSGRRRCGGGARLCRGHGAGRLGFRQGKKRRERRSSEARGSSLSSRGGPGAREPRWRAWRHGGNGNSVPPVATVTMELTGGDPLSESSPFLVFQNFQQHFVFN